MSQFVRNRIRCELKVSEAAYTKFTSLISGASPKSVKGAGCQWELALYNDDDTLFDISNLASVTLQITNSTGTVQVTKTVTPTPSATAGSLNAGLTEAQWTEGSAQHVLVIFSDSEMAFAAGSTYLVTVSGVTSDDNTDTDCLGRADFELVEAYINAGAAATTPGKTPVYAEDLAGILAGVLRRINGPGVTGKFTSPNGTRTLEIGVDDDGNPISNIV